MSISLSLTSLLFLYLYFILKNVLSFFFLAFTKFIFKLFIRFTVLLPCQPLLIYLQSP